MTGNTFGQFFKITTWGESHGRAVGVVVDGVPAGLEINKELVEDELKRRRPGQSSVSTPRKETDEVEILSGVFDNKSTGTPISMLVWNKNANSSSYEHLKNLPRPGHADYFYLKKYGIRDYRGGGRSSARETVGRVAAGAIAKALLETYGTKIVAHVVELGGIRAKKLDFDKIMNNLEKTPLRCADLDAAEKMLEKAEHARDMGDSIGGIVEVVVKGVPAGIGEPVFDKLDADLSKAIMSIGAVKGVEFGTGFESSRMNGSEMNDSFVIENGDIKTDSNNAGGIIGGLSTGMPIICRAFVKPTPSISKTQKTVNLSTMEETKVSVTGRHDPTIPPRMVPVAESMVALVIADHMIRSGNISPDSLLG
ncbi:chorismate synthase [Methanohalobium sp.]|uniref:chorismate synthase n=1 Tax=Methanohalobium sp. TaxID=2837493 RepID=UPI0025E8772C|nr:chorismate synthase [Methanohalobium sp.]